MKELTTPFGILYIDSWNKDERPDEGRIVIYDSRKDFLDYFCLDYFYDGIDEDSNAEQEYNKLCEMLECGAEEKTIHRFLDWLCVDYCWAGMDKVMALSSLAKGDLENFSLDELETNEWVNHIGDYYIIVAEI